MTHLAKEMDFPRRSEKVMPRVKVKVTLRPRAKKMDFPRRSEKVTPRVRVKVTPRPRAKKMDFRLRKEKVTPTEKEMATQTLMETKRHLVKVKDFHLQTGKEMLMVKEMVKPKSWL